MRLQFSVAMLCISAIAALFFVDRAAVESQQQVLWNLWPMIILVLLGWAIASAIFLSRSYSMIIRDYARGVATRAEQHLNCDISRLQEVANWGQYPERSAEL